ncbi:MAG: mandelate racemase/muconate lactonizing enzyme family protein [Pseudomonadota bacterium]
MNRKIGQPTIGQHVGDGMEIVELRAFPVSVAVENGAQLAIGRAVKRDAVVVRVTTASGIVGFGESHHARSANIVANIVNTTLRDLILPCSAADISGIWAKIYEWQLRSHGLGAAVVMAMSGLDMALWDIKAKLAGLPLCQLLGGVSRPIKAYAGGVALGWQEPSALVDEIAPHAALGYKAVKLRVGDQVALDIERVAAVRKAYGDDMVIMVDANTGYSLEDVRNAMPAYEEMGVRWLEEPFAANDYRSYQAATHLGKVPLAAGENHYTRYEFARLVEDRAVTILQPDLSKVGGPSEVMRIAALGSAWRLSICPHSCITAINMAATIHLLSAIDNAGYFEADVSIGNAFREKMGQAPYQVAADGTVRSLDAPGIGIDADEAFLLAHPFIDGKNFV